MNRKLNTFLGSLLLVAASAATTGIAAASPAQDYREAMKPFVPTIETWAARLEKDLEASTAKPEVACGAEMQSMQRIGRSIAIDLLGMGPSVPEGMTAAHNDLTAAVMGMTSAAKNACGQSSQAIRNYRDEVDRYSSGMGKIKHFTDGVLIGPSIGEPKVPDSTR